jgi:uncharacterized protein
MSGHRGPMPDLSDPLVAPFFAASAEGRLVVQRCPACGYRRWPPGPMCPQCQTIGNDWADVRPTGTLYSYVTYHRALNPAFANEVPYTVGLVELDDGPRMYGRLTGDYKTDRVGTPVQAVFKPVIPEVAFVWWTPRAG